MPLKDNVVVVVDGKTYDIQETIRQIWRIPYYFSIY